MKSTRKPSDWEAFTVRQVIGGLSVIPQCIGRRKLQAFFWLWTQIAVQFDEQPPSNGRFGHAGQPFLVTPSVVSPSVVIPDSDWDVFGSGQVLTPAFLTHRLTFSRQLSQVAVFWLRFLQAIM